MWCSAFVAATFLAALYTSEIGAQTSHQNLRLINKPGCGSGIEVRIFHPPYAEIGEYPWMAILTRERAGKEIDYCAGTLITDKYILTAAHCILDKKLMKHVRLGEYDVATNPDCEDLSGETFCNPPTQNFTIKRTIVHPLYSSQSHHNDIALIELNNRVNMTDANYNYYSDDVKPVCLPVGEEGSKIEEKMQLSTWDLHKSNKTRMLKKPFVTFMNHVQCNAAYVLFPNINITDKQFCGNLHPDCDTLGGSPIQGWRVKAGRIGSHIQYGIISFGLAQCRSDVPEVFTDVRQYITWILDSITA